MTKPWLLMLVRLNSIGLKRLLTLIAGCVDVNSIECKSENPKLKGGRFTQLGSNSGIYVNGFSYRDRISGFRLPGSRYPSTVEVARITRVYFCLLQKLSLYFLKVQIPKFAQFYKFRIELIYAYIPGKCMVTVFCTHSDISSQYCHFIRSML